MLEPWRHTLPPSHVGGHPSINLLEEAIKLGLGGSEFIFIYAFGSLYGSLGGELKGDAVGFSTQAIGFCCYALVSDYLCF